jgi:Icc protein
MTAKQSYFSILQLSDLHILPTSNGRLLGIATEHYFHACLEQAVRLRSRQAFDLIILTGDLAQDPCLASYQRLLNTLDAYKIPCICLPGNHDDYNLMQQVFNTENINCQKQLLLANWQLISLNSQVPGKAEGHLSKKELNFLEHCLSENPNRHALIAVHHHCLATQSFWMDTMILDNSQEFLAIIDKYPQAKVITNGHIHQVMDIKIENLRVLGVPSTCFQFTPKSAEFSVNDTAPGYRLIDLYEDGRVESEVMRLPAPLLGLNMNKQGY